MDLHSFFRHFEPLLVGCATAFNELNEDSYCIVFPFLKHSVRIERGISLSYTTSNSFQNVKIDNTSMNFQIKINIGVIFWNRFVALFERSNKV